jgi:nucleoside-diphosphate-sugar epimerase
MRIIGSGFLARHLAPLAGSHKGVTVIAAGVSAAGDTPQRAFDREAALLFDVIHECEPGERLVFFSTASTGMYSVPGDEPGTEDGPVFPATAYGRHKFALEAVLAASGVDYLILRLGHVVGPHQPPHQLLPALARQVQAGDVRIYRNASRDLIDIRDVVTIVDALLAGAPERLVVNVASGVPVPVERIVDRVETLLGTPARHTYVDAPAAAQPVSTRRLRRLVPAVTGMGFGPGYYEGLLDRYLPYYAAGDLKLEAAPG